VSGPDHRHHNKNETLVLWGAAGVVRVERPGGVINDYRMGVGDRVLIASPSGLGHAIKAAKGGADMNIVVGTSTTCSPHHSPQSLPVLATPSVAQNTKTILLLR